MSAGDVSGFSDASGGEEVSAMSRNIRPKASLTLTEEEAALHRRVS